MNPFENYNTPMPDDLKVDKAKFDAILRRIARSKPLAEDERKIGREPRTEAQKRARLRKKSSD